jgi:hypothetical protein
MLQSVKNWFQIAQRPMFLPYLLVRVFKFVDLGGVGIRTLWSFWFSIFPSLYMSDQVLKIDEDNDVRTRDSGKAMHGFVIPQDMTSLFLIKVSWPEWLVKLGVPPNICSFKVTSLTKHKTSLSFAKRNVNLCNHNHNLNWINKASCDQM